MAGIVKEEEVFFETVDNISATSETDDESEESFYAKSAYGIWISEPQSVLERRERFIRGMGMAETFTDPEGILQCGTEYLYYKESRFGALDSSFVRENPLFSSELETGDEEISSSESLEPDKSDMVSTSSSEIVPGPVSFMLESECKEGNYRPNKHNRHSSDKKKRNWLDLLLARNTKLASKLKPSQMKVSPEHKKCIEFSAVYVRQKIKAHSGCIRVLKISPDGHYLASGGEDGVIRIWLITTADGDDLKADGTQSLSAHVVIPAKLFHIEGYPLYEYFGHSGCVVDLTWSESNNYLVSSSKDGTARLWQIGTVSCLNVFHHNNPGKCPYDVSCKRTLLSVYGYRPSPYLDHLIHGKCSYEVICAFDEMKFNPIDDDYFISGSVDGKVRIWGTFKGRVTDWIDTREAITAICYQPDGTGFIVGSSSGICRFYGYSGDDLHLQIEAQVHMHGTRKTPSNKITSIMFSPDERQRIMITANDSVVRILDGVNVVHKYKGLRKSSAQLSASFTSTGRHIISLDADSRIYVWNYDGAPSPRFRKSSKNSCEHFLFKDASVAIPWSPITTAQASPFSSKRGRVLDPMSFSGDSWLPIVGGSTPLREDVLPSPDWDVPIAQCPSISRYHSFPTDSFKRPALSKTWGLVIVTASRDGVIRTFHNYGLPVEVGSCPQLIQSIPP